MKLELPAQYSKHSVTNFISNLAVATVAVVALASVVRVAAEYFGKAAIAAGARTVASDAPYVTVFAGVATHGANTVYCIAAKVFGAVSGSFGSSAQRELLPPSSEENKESEGLGANQPDAVDPEAQDPEAQDPDAQD